MLGLQLERIQRSNCIDKIVVATSTRFEDLAIVSFCDKLGIDSYRGDLNNVLDRFYQTSCQYQPEHIVRLTGDCPLIDVCQLDDLISFYLMRSCDYVGNFIDAEAFSFKTLQAAWDEATLSYDLEHVTPYILNHPERFEIIDYRCEHELYMYRWWVDEPEDFKFVRAIYEALYPINPEFDFNDIFDLLKRRPELEKTQKRSGVSEGKYNPLKTLVG